MSLADRDPWRFGVLFSQSGVTSAVERTQLQATILAAETINRDGGLLGRRIELVAHDGRSEPSEFRKLAQRLLTEDNVRLIFGCYMSSTRKAVLPIVEAYRGLLMYPTLYEGFEYSPNCIYTGSAPNQNSLPLACYLFKHYGTRVFFVGSDYVYPHESNRIMADLVRQAGGSVVGVRYLPLNAQADDFASTIRDIGHLRPDVIFSTVVGRATARFYEAYHAAGFNSRIMPIASLTTSEAEVAEMTPAAACGHISAAPFFSVLRTPAAAEFLNAFSSRFGSEATVSAAAEAAYFQFGLVCQAIETIGTDSPDLVRLALSGLEFEAPQGRIAVDAANNHTCLWPRVARLDASGRFEIVWDPGVRVRPDPYCIDQDLDSWSAPGAQLVAMQV